MTDNAKLRAKLDEAKKRLPLPSLMRQLGYDDKHIGKEALCPFHLDEHPSFSVFQRRDGTWWHRCFIGCSQGDEVAFLVRHFSCSSGEAIKLYLEMAGFPPPPFPKSHEYPNSLVFPESHERPVSPVSPVSNGQAIDREKEKMLKALAARNACTQCNTARRRRWKLVRDLRALEKGIGRELNIDELVPVFDEWYRRSQPFLDPAKTNDAYLAAFLTELRKVRVPTGEGNTLNHALAAVSRRTNSELPLIPGLPNAPEHWRRLLALHSELSTRSTRKNKTYFLSYRDAAKAHEQLTHQLAYDITLAFDRLGLIKIVDKGNACANGGRATEFRYLLPQNGNGTSEAKKTAGAKASSW
jgi:hypothetical protein